MAGSIIRQRLAEITAKKLKGEALKKAMQELAEAGASESDIALARKKFKTSEC